MNWITLTADDLRDQKVAALVEALQSAALATGQTDPTERIIQTVTDRIRRKIASNSANAVDSDETKIPRGLKADAVTLVLAQMKGRLELDLTDFERNEVERIESDLNRIAEGRDSVEQPDDAVDSSVQPTGGSPLYEARKRRFDRADGYRL